MNLYKTMCEFDADGLVALKASGFRFRLMMKLKLMCIVVM